MPPVEGEGAVMRLLRRSKNILSLEDLGIPDHLLDELKKTLQSPEGLFLVTGPTGSGKTTTLYAALQEIDTDCRTAVTLEDPLEYPLERIRRNQIKPKKGMKFARGRSGVVRDDTVFARGGGSR